MLHAVQEELSLREQKRRATRRRIEDAATRLVDERSFADVTIEEICEAAGISRRTFFNYFDSKDSAVLGLGSDSFGPELQEQFLQAESDNIVALTITLLRAHLEDYHPSREVMERRRRIASDEDVAAATMSRKRAASNAVLELIERRLEQDSHLRTMPHLAPRTEALLIGGLIREAVWLAMASPDFHEDDSLEYRFDTALTLITDFTKGLAW